MLKEQLTEIVKKKKPSKTLLGWLEKRKALFVAIAGFFATFFALFQPITEYLSNIGKHEQAKFNTEMIGLIKSISDPDQTIQERNLFILTSYDPEVVIPFLLDDVNREPEQKKRENRKEISTDVIREAIKQMWMKIKDPYGFQKFTNFMTFTKSKKEIVGNIIFQYSTNSFAELNNYNSGDPDDSINVKIRSLNYFYLNLTGDICLSKINTQIIQELDNLKTGVDTIFQGEDAPNKVYFNDLITYAKCKQ